MNICHFFSGIPQGKLIKRQRLPKNDLGDNWHWKDFNIGVELTFYGKNFMVYDCNEWTKVRLGYFFLTYVQTKMQCFINLC